MFCTNCGEKNLDDATVCRACGEPLREEDRNSELVIPPIPLLPEAPIVGGQPASGSVPMVQGTPQPSGVPTVSATPSTLNAPSVGQFSSQGGAAPSAQAASPGAASSPPQAGSQGIASSPQAGTPGAAPSVAQGVPSSAPLSAPSASSPAPGPSSPAIGEQTSPTQFTPQPPTHHPPGQPPTHHPGGQPSPTEPGTLSSHSSTASQHLVSGGKKAARGLLPRAALLGIVAGAVVVAVAIGAILYLSHPAQGGSTPNNTVSVSSTSAGNPGKPTSTASTPTSTTAASTSTPDKTVRTFIEALNKKDTSTAYNQFSTHFKSQFSEQQFASTYVNGASNYTLTTTQENSSSATVLFTEHDSRCQGGQDTFQLVIENGVWKIDAITITKVCP